MSYKKHDDIEDISEHIEDSDNPVEEKDIYENGKILNIGIEEIVNNKVAVKQLINSNNTTKKRLFELEKSNKNKDVEIGLLKVQPFVSIICIVINIISTTILSIGVNILTGTKGSILGIILLILGIIGELAGNAIPVIYPFYIRNQVLK